MADDGIKNHLFLKAMFTKLLSVIMNKRVFPIILVLVVAGLFWTLSSLGSDKNTNSLSKQQVLLQTVAAIIEQKHYSPKKIDDNFSKQVFKKYLETLDGEKNTLLATDIKALKKYETAIDDEMHGKPIMFYTAVGAIYLKRVEEVKAIYREILSKPFEFTTNESIVLDNDKVAFASNESERKERWRKRLKFLVLERYADMLEQREKAIANNIAFAKIDATKQDSANKKMSFDSIALKTDAQLEIDARNRVLKIIDRSFERSKKRLEDNEQFSLFINTITELMDPHTEYFAPIEKRSFDEQMSGRFYGIGALLREDESVIKLANIVTGSPAWKSKELGVNDIIVKVAQGAGEPVDISGYAIEDAVKLIRGAKGTEVRLTVKKTDGTIKVVSIIRDEIVQDETFARSAIVNKPDGKKVGYIYLPEFYADFDRENGARCAVDVAGEVMKLKSENVDGIVIDLRNNGGGSLYEVINMVGLFIKSGPVVQVKDRDGKPTILNDTDPNILYDGPLAVMVNEFSASASEIFAAAIQDYKRGIVIGSTSTYGKGTVQKSVPLGRQFEVFGDNRSDIGSLKLTFEKFYRVNGESTQLEGVKSDVVIPDTYEFLKFREKDNESALPWDKIEGASIRTTHNYNIDDATKTAKENVAKITNLNSLKKNAEWLTKRNEMPYSLQLDKYIAEQKIIKNTAKENEGFLKLKDTLNIKPPTVDNNKYFNNPDKIKGERYQQWLKSLNTDIYLQEATNIIGNLKKVIPVETVQK